jgi:transposase-like protein
VVDVAEPSAENWRSRELVRSARARGVATTGAGGMLQALTKTVIETALDEEMTDHLGYGKRVAAAARVVTSGGPRGRRRGARPPTSRCVGH